MRSLLVDFLFLDVGPLDVVELPIEFCFVVDDVFDVGIELFGDVIELVPPPILEDIGGFDLIPLGHDISARPVLGQHEVLDGKGDDNEEEEEFGLVVREDNPRVQHVS